MKKLFCSIKIFVEKSPKMCSRIYNLFWCSLMRSLLIFWRTSKIFTQTTYLNTTVYHTTNNTQQMRRFLETWLLLQRKLIPTKLSTLVSSLCYFRLHLIWRSPFSLNNILFLAHWTSCCRKMFYHQLLNVKIEGNAVRNIKSRYQ